MRDRARWSIRRDPGGAGAGSSSGAQYAAPATVILNTKSGTNQLHGSLFETARNNAFGIARSRSDQSNFADRVYPQ